VLRGGEVLATGSSMHAFVDRQGRPTRPPAWVIERIDAAFGS